MSGAEVTPVNTDDILADPAASVWLKAAILALDGLDPVDAANDTEVLAELMRVRCDAMMANYCHPDRPEQPTWKCNVCRNLQTEGLKCW